MRVVVFDDLASYGRKKLSTQDNYIPSLDTPDPHKQPTPATTTSHNAPVAPQCAYPAFPPLQSLSNNRQKMTRHLGFPLLSFGCKRPERVSTSGGRHAFQVGRYMI